MFFYAVKKTRLGLHGGEVVSMHVSREEAWRMINILTTKDENSDPQMDYEYSVKTIPVNIQKMIELGIVGSEAK